MWSGKLKSRKKSFTMKEFRNDGKKKEPYFRPDGTFSRKE
jgi:hypothetical protein